MITQIGKTAEDVAGKVASYGERAAHNVEQAADRAAKDLGATAEQLRDYASEGVDRMQVAIRRSPLASAAIAAGVGFFLAALARR